MGRAIADFATLSDVPPGSHVCWIVGDHDDYVRDASRLLSQAGSTNEKPVVFGPEGSAPLEISIPWRW